LDVTADSRYHGGGFPETLPMKSRNPQSGCDDFRTAQRLSRREALRIGGLGGLGLTLPQLLAANSNAAEKSPTFGRAKRVIMLYLHGGHPQQETFDPKPEGPSAVRGEFGAIATSVAGVRFSEVLPRMATRMHRLAIVRSMSHANPNHVQASLPANTGHKHPPGEKRGDFPPSETDFPPFGAVLDHLRPMGGHLPTWVRVGPLMRRNNGTVLHGQLPGFLGAKHMHFAVDQKLTGRDVRVEAVQPADDLTSIRLSARRDLLRQFDAQRRLIDESAAARRFDVFTQKAFSLLSSPATRKAFDLAAESPATRARYGDTEFGQRCLLARRLAEAGVPMVNVSYCHTPRGSWDTHSRNFTQMKRSLAPTLDTAFSALLDDLADRRLLDDTLVIVNAEFGRTPKINRNAGRDHWPWVYSLALAGAGLRPGVVHGASDTSAAYPTAHPHDPADMAATIYHLLGVDPKTTLYDKLRRPHHLVIGKPIAAILG
jgi:uncharacterized protein (DUF1501 family)